LRFLIGEFGRKRTQNFEAVGINAKAQSRQDAEKTGDNEGRGILTADGTDFRVLAAVQTMCIAFTRHSPSCTPLFLTNPSTVSVMFTNPTGFVAFL
jgi:hypothetical protein